MSRYHLSLPNSYAAMIVCSVAPIWGASASTGIAALCSAAWSSLAVDECQETLEGSGVVSTTKGLDVAAALEVEAVMERREDEADGSMVVKMDGEGAALLGTDNDSGGSDVVVLWGVDRAERLTVERAGDSLAGGAGVRV